MAIILKELFEEVEAAAYLAVATDEACLAQEVSIFKAFSFFFCIEFSI